MVSKLLGNMWAPIKLHSIMYKLVFQAVLLYRSEIWVVTDAMMTVLDIFYHCIA